VHPLESVTDAFSGMPKNSAALRDGWTWKLRRDAAQIPSTATLLRKFAERFSNGALTQDLWAYLASALLYPFYNKMPEERTSTTDPALRPVTVGYVLTRFGCRVMVTMNRMAVAAELLLSHQFSFGINGGVHQVIMACTITLKINPSWLMLDLDLTNAPTLCSRDRLEEELELNMAYRYMLESFKALYGKTVIVQWHFGNRPDKPAASFHMSCEGLGQGDAPATVYFNVLAARVYMKQLRTLDGMGVLFAVVDDEKILGPPEVIKEMAEGFPTLAWEETGLTTQTFKNRIYVQSSAQASWSRFIGLTPRNTLTELPVQDISDGSNMVDPFDPDTERIWMEKNGVNILGTPLGSNSFVTSYLRGMKLKHHLLLRFIKDVAAAGFPKEAEHMLKGAAVARLSHILRSVQKNKHTVGWMTKMDGAHLSALIHCLTVTVNSLRYDGVKQSIVTRL